MKVFVAGATGAVGRALVPLLVEAGHAVTGMTRSAGKQEAIRATGAEPVVADALDRDAVMAAVVGAEPEVVVHELTAIPAKFDMRNFDRVFETTNRLRTEGTDHLLEAARAVGARRFVAQSFAGWPYARTGGPVKTEEDALDPDPPASMRRTLDAIRRLEAAVLGADGIEGSVLRYGGFYGPGTGLGAMLDEVRRRRFPLVGKGTGVWSLVHVDDAAAATLAAIERGAPGVYNVVDDDPAPVLEWLPYLAESIGAKPPRRVPSFVGRLAAGDAGLSLMTRIRGASNAKAKRELGWQPRYASWREGFREGLGA
jgi:nucleoside-diphosphate-sugar epimerase